jgi:D-glycero-D-manno-heptose 1,7-bisphosphate phosphatase
MKRPAVFFDRDNTLIACDGYLGDPAKVELIDGAADAVVRCRDLGFAVVVFSNQSGVARGMFGEEAVHAVNHRLDDLLHEDDPRAVIDRHDFCPFHPTAKVEKYRKDSDLRKPKPGMIYQAAQALDLDLAKSWAIGDAPRDIAAGHAAGLKTVLLKIAGLPPSPATAEGSGVDPDFVATSLKEAVDFVEREVRAAEEKIRAEAEAREKAEREAREKEEAEARAKAEAEAREKAEAEARERAENEARQRAEAEALSAAKGEAAAQTSTADSSRAEPAVAAAVAEESPKVVSPAVPAVSVTSRPAQSAPVRPAKSEETVKPTPRSTPDASKTVKPNTPKPVQGGFVVKPNQAPTQMSWGERMRMAKQGGVPSGAPAKPVLETPEPAAEPEPAPAPTKAESREPEVIHEAAPAAEAEVFEGVVIDHSGRVSRAPAETASVPSPAAPPVEEPPPQRPPMMGQRREEIRTEPALNGEHDTALATRSADAEEETAPPESTGRRGSSGSRTNDLLEQILLELRRREEQTSLDFSWSKMMAGVMQVVALFVLFIAYLNRDNTANLQNALLLALTLQVLTISLLIMGRQK